MYSASGICMHQLHSVMGARARAKVNGNCLCAEQATLSILMRPVACVAPSQTLITSTCKSALTLLAIIMQIIGTFACNKIEQQSARCRLKINVMRATHNELARVENNNVIANEAIHVLFP
jgi:hypothetical protein